MLFSVFGCVVGVNVVVFVVVWRHSSDKGCLRQGDRLCESVVAVEGRYQPENMGQSLKYSISHIYKYTENKIKIKCKL